MIRKLIAEWLAYACMAAMLAIIFWGGIVVRFQNPDMTEARLILTYWPWYAGAVGLAVLAHLLMAYKERP